MDKYEALVRELLNGNDIVKTNRLSRKLHRNGHSIGHMMGRFCLIDGMVWKMGVKQWGIDKPKLKKYLEQKLNSGEW